MIRKCFAALCLTVGILAVAPAGAQERSGIQRMIVMRHAEKPPAGLGQLSCQGLNRALMLPSVLAEKFPAPDRIFVPDPAVRVYEIAGDGQSYDYVRPLLTIGPTAIALGMPVNTEIAFNAPGKLADRLLEPEFQDATIYVVWEHFNIIPFAKLVLKRLGSSQHVPDWPNTDYDTVFDLTIQWNAPRSARLDIKKLEMGDIPVDCPVAARK